MTKWNDIQAQAKRIIDEGMHALKSGLSEAEFLAGTTASAAKLHMDAGRRRFEMYRTLHDLGAVLYNAALSGAESGSIALTPAMRSLIDNARSIEKMLANDAALLERISVVKKAAPSPPTEAVVRARIATKRPPKKRTRKTRPAARGGRNALRHP